MTHPQLEVLVAVEPDGSAVSVNAEGLRDRAALLFFRSVLGGSLDGDAWICPTRGKAAAPLVVRINTWLERQGHHVRREGMADVAVEREIERRRSFTRSRDAGRGARGGAPALSASSLQSILDEAGWSEARHLRDHQVRGALHALSSVNAANFSVPGAGKTATTLAVASVHRQLGNVDLVVVVGPLSSFRPWETEASAALPGRLRTRRIRGTASQRRAAYGQVRPGDLIMMSYATAAHDLPRLLELLRSYKPMLIVDESHRVKRFRGGMWAPALQEIAKLCRVRVILSGTPMPQGGRDLYSQLCVLWPGQELTGPRDTFAALVRRDMDAVVDSVLPFVSRTPKDALGLPAYELVRHAVPMDEAHDEIYQGLLDNMRAAVAGAGPQQADRLAALRRARPIRLLQAATSPALLARADAALRLPPLREVPLSVIDLIDRYSVTQTPAKALAAAELLRQLPADGKCVVWSNFLSNLDSTAELVRSELGILVCQVDGRVPAGDNTSDDEPGILQLDSTEAETREQVIDRFLDHDGQAVLLANPASCSESISLHRSCRSAIYLDRTYDCALWLQSIDRIHRLGLPLDAQVNVHVLLATRIDGSPTVDDLVDAALLAKDTAMRQLLDGADLLPLNASEDLVENAEGDDGDLVQLLKYLLGEEARR